MQVSAHRSLSVLACTLVVLFFVLSVNAYACLLPVNGVAAAQMGTGCSNPEEQPVVQACDAFKTLSVHSADKLQLNSDYQALCPEDTASLALRVIHTSPSNRLSSHPTIGSPQDLLLKISVLRI